MDRGTWWATVQGITRVRHNLALSFFFSNKHQGFPGGSVVKNLPANAEGAGDVGSIPGSGRSPGGGHGNPLQYSCLENPHGQRNLTGTAQGVAKEWDVT